MRKTSVRAWSLAGVGIVAAWSALSAAQLRPPPLPQPLPPGRRPPPQHLCASSTPRPLVIVGGWSNCPAHFTGSQLYAQLLTARGGRVLLTTHADAWGDIDANALAEAQQIVTFMDGLLASGSVCSPELDVVGFSMGGLIVRSIATKHPDALGPYHFANLVTLATPNHGASPTLWDIVDYDKIFHPSVNPCPAPPAKYSTTVAAQEMMPHSPFLTDLNGRAVPASTRVTTITGEALIDPLDVQPAMCDATCGALRGLGLAAMLPSGAGLPNRIGTLAFDDQWQGACQIYAGGRQTGACNADTVCPPA
jgi:pimeloyl-ACP methyl ester carboxylesterase